MWSTLQNRLLQLIFCKKYFCNHPFFFFKYSFGKSDLFEILCLANSKFGNFDFWNCQQHGEQSNVDYDRGSVCRSIVAHIMWDITLFDVTMWVTWSDQMMMIFATCHFLSTCRYLVSILPSQIDGGALKSHSETQEYSFSFSCLSFFLLYFF